VQFLYWTEKPLFSRLSGIRKVAICHQLSLYAIKKSRRFLLARKLRTKRFTRGGPCAMVMPDNKTAVLKNLIQTKGGQAFDMASWEDISREDLLLFLQELVQSAPRAAAEAWRDGFLLPLLAQKEQEGVVQTSA
jgi:hypothetical protein